MNLFLPLINLDIHWVLEIERVKNWMCCGVKVNDLKFSLLRVNSRCSWFYLWTIPTIIYRKSHCRLEIWLPWQLRKAKTGKMFKFLEQRRKQLLLRPNQLLRHPRPPTLSTSPLTSILFPESDPLQIFFSLSMDLNQGKKNPYCTCICCFTFTSWQGNFT